MKFLNILFLLFISTNALFAQNQFTEIWYQEYFPPLDAHTVQIEVQTDELSLVRIVDRDGNSYGNSFFVQPTNPGEVFCLQGIDMPIGDFTSTGDNIGFVLVKLSVNANEVFDNPDAWISINNPGGISLAFTGPASSTNSSINMVYYGSGTPINASTDIGNQLPTSVTPPGTSLQFAFGGAGVWVSGNVQSCGQPNIVALPVELVEFNATRTTEEIKLSWATASEEQTDNFDIERKIGNNGIYVSIGDVDSQSDQYGNSSSRLEYEYIDDDLEQLIDKNDIVYYRLKVTDLDFDIEYSPSRSVDFTNASNKSDYSKDLVVTLEPNLITSANKNIKVEFENRAKVDYLIITAIDGTVVYKIENFDANTLYLPSNIFENKGMYGVSIKDGTNIKTKIITFQ